MYFTILIMIAIKHDCLAFSLEFQSFSRSLEYFFLTVGQNNFGNKIPGFFTFCQKTPKEGIISFSVVSAVWLTVLTAALIWRMTLGQEYYLVGYVVGNNYGAKSFKNSHLNFNTYLTRFLKLPFFHRVIIYKKVQGGWMLL